MPTISAYYDILWKGVSKTRGALVSDLSVLSDQTRLDLLRLLAERPLTVGHLQKLLGVSQSAVSQHLARLRAGGWVQADRVGQQVLYHWRPGRLDRTVGDLRGLFAAPLETLPELGERWRRLFAGPAVALVDDGTEMPAPPQLPATPHILFVCTGNSARSQMAEGFTRALSAAGVVAESAGLEPAGLHPLAVQVMAEIGLDISGQSSKTLTPQHLEQADIVVTLCGGPAGWRPEVRPQARWLHWPLPDPAQATGAPYRRMARFRDVRDQVRRYVDRLLADWTGTPAPAPIQ